MFLENKFGYWESFRLGLWERDYTGCKGICWCVTIEDRSDYFIDQPVYLLDRVFRIPSHIISFFNPDALVRKELFVRVGSIGKREDSITRMRRGRAPKFNDLFLVVDHFVEDILDILNESAEILIFDSRMIENESVNPIFIAKIFFDTSSCIFDLVICFSRIFDFFDPFSLCRTADDWFLLLISCVDVFDRFPLIHNCGV